MNIINSNTNDINTNNGSMTLAVDDSSPEHDTRPSAQHNPLSQSMCTIPQPTSELSLGEPEAQPEADKAIETAPANEYGPAIVGLGSKQTVNQEHLVARYIHESGILYDSTNSLPYIYDVESGLWVYQTDEAICHELGRYFQRIVEEEGCLHLLTKRTEPFLRKLCRLIPGRAKRSVFERPQNVIHVGNGMLVIDENGNVELMPFSPDYYSRNRSGIPWDPNAKCPRFKQKLLLSAMDDDDASLMQRYAGQILLGDNISQTFLVLRGRSGGGKSTFSNVLEGVIGEKNVTELRVKQLTERFEVGRLSGHTLLCGKDVPGDFLNMKSAYVLKSLVGGDPLGGEVKYGNESLKINGRFNILISTNTRIRIKLDSDEEAWGRRMLIVDYTRPSPVKRISDFDELLLKEEGPGILRWMVEGAIALKRELDEFGSIQLTDAQSRRVEDLLSESDSVQTFVQNYIEESIGEEITLDDLNVAYHLYCTTRKWKPKLIKEFKSELPDAMLDIFGLTKQTDIPGQNGKRAHGYRDVQLITASGKPSEHDHAESFTDVSSNTMTYTGEVKKGNNSSKVQPNLPNHPNNTSPRKVTVTVEF